MQKIGVGVIGATGMVGQNYVRLLDNHPWFEVVYVAASPRSAGKSYKEAVAGRWHMAVEIPESVRNLTVGDANQADSAVGKCSLIFSAVEMDKAAVAALEEEYAALDIPVVSNNSAHRHTSDVPVLIPEINAGHLDIIPAQRENHGWKKGLIVVKPNCSVQSYMAPVYALARSGYAVDKMIVTTLQAVSGAGYPGPASISMIDNIVPYIGGEEEKSEVEPLKILGHIENGGIVNDHSIRISAHCNRVPATDGHTACVSMQFAEKAPAMDEILDIWREFSAKPQELDLPTAPQPAIIYRDEADRPQPRMDRDAGGGMAFSIGRLRPCNVFDYRFVGLTHNTVRGAAGGAILIAELLKAEGWIS
jgi:aspartate-semialdehyde dehydrogenase